MISLAPCHMWFALTILLRIRIRAKLTETERVEAAVLIFRHHHSVDRCAC